MAQFIPGAVFVCIIRTRLTFLLDFKIITSVSICHLISSEISRAVL